MVVAGSLQQIEFFSPVDRCLTVVHLKLVVDVSGVGPHGVQGHHELAGNVRATQIGASRRSTSCSRSLNGSIAARLAGAALNLAGGRQQVTGIGRVIPRFTAASSRTTMGRPSSTLIADNDKKLVVFVGKPIVATNGARVLPMANLVIPIVFDASSLNEP